MSELHKFRNIDERLSAIQQDMENYARQYGLDFFHTVFEMVDHDQLNAIAAYGGFPTRYPHWRFGMEYERLSKAYAYGLQKIYEMVINNDPCYAYLLASNSETDHKLVMAHVYGHCDFFKNNAYFAHTNRNMIDAMANHGNRIRRYIRRFGADEVESFLDACLSLEDLIDIHSTFVQRSPPRSSKYEFPSPTAMREEDTVKRRRLPAKDYLDPFVNPKQAPAETKDADASEPHELVTPARPTRDVLLFLIENAPLKAWQADVLSIVRDEAYYFAPQAQTKIMNEGWATYWHSTIMTKHGMEPADLICYADHCAGTLASHPARLNPYKLGVELFRDIEDRWNRGRFGEAYENCTDLNEKLHWDRQTGLGREKIFEVRRIHNDLTFIDEFLTLEFCQRHKLFRFGYNDRYEQYEIESRSFPEVKKQLLANLTNLGRPLIEVANANYKNRGELLLRHEYEGVELQIDYAADTLVNLYRIWRRPVHLHTTLNNEEAHIGFDGREHHIQAAKPDPDATAVVAN